VGPDDEAVGLAGDEHRGFDFDVRLELGEERAKFVVEARFEDVDRLPGNVVRDHGHAVIAYARRKDAHVASKTTTAPRPPAAQTDKRPNCFLRFFSSRSVETTIRAPVAANGCPMAIEPPLTLILAGSISPIASPRPRCSSANFLDAMAFKLEATCA